LDLRFETESARDCFSNPKSQIENQKWECGLLDYGEAEMTRRCRGVVGGVVVALGLCLSAGCQTWLGGMTLPSGQYLTDNPDYVPPGPSFPLPRELAAQQAAAKASEGTGGATGGNP
jgi:hypothetical protein